MNEKMEFDFEAFMREEGVATSFANDVQGLVMGTDRGKIPMQLDALYAHFKKYIKSVDTKQHSAASEYLLDAKKRGPITKQDAERLLIEYLEKTFALAALSDSEKDAVRTFIAGTWNLAPRK